jgi:hypothetical protein
MQSITHNDLPRHRLNFFFLLEELKETFNFVLKKIKLSFFRMTFFSQTKMQFHFFNLCSAKNSRCCQRCRFDQKWPVGANEWNNFGKQF